MNVDDLKLRTCKPAIAEGILDSESMTVFIKMFLQEAAAHLEAFLKGRTIDWNLRN